MKWGDTFLKALISVGKLYSALLYDSEISWNLDSNDFESFVRVDIVRRSERSKGFDTPDSLMIVDSDTLFLDELTLSNDLYNIHGEVNIIYHPVYQIPTPFFRYFNQNGDVLNNYQMDRMKICLNSNDDLNCNDNRFHVFGSLIVDNHPFYGTPYYSLHVCNTKELLNLANSILSNKHDSTNHLVSALNWLSLFGPHMGMPLTAHMYSNLLNQISKQ